MSGIQLFGWSAGIAKINKLRADYAAVERDKVRWVGTSVFWSVFSEFGTSHEPAKPWFRPAFAVGKGVWLGGGTTRKKGANLKLQVSSRSMLDPVADAVVEAATRNIVTAGLVHSSKLSRSIAKGKTSRELSRNSKKAAKGA